MTYRQLSALVLSLVSNVALAGAGHPSTDHQGKHPSSMASSGASTTVSTPQATSSTAKQVPESDTQDQQASQSIHFTNNETVKITLSKDDPNRLFIQGDKIQNIACKKGFCVTKLMPESGDAMLSLGPMARASQGFTFYITTKQERHLTVVALPEHGVGQTIQFIPASGGSSKAAQFEKKSPYQQTLTALIQYMMRYPQTGQAPPGYAVADVDQQTPTANNSKSDVLVFPVRFFRGMHFAGLVYGVKNTSDHKMTISPRQFYEKGMLAGAVAKRKLKPGEITRLYEVVER